MGKVFIFGEMHTPEYYMKEINAIEYLHRKIGLSYLIQETAFDYVLESRNEIEEKIKDKDWMLGPEHYEMGLMFDLPIIGMDLSREERNRLHTEVDTDDDFSESFRMREDRMVSVIEEYRKWGNCVVTVGDTHLRMVETERLGRPSPLWTKYRDDKDVFIFRINSRDREADYGIHDRRIYQYRDLKKIKL